MSLIQAPINHRDAPICTATALPPCSAVFCSQGPAASAESNCLGRIATARIPGKCACDAAGAARLRDRNMPRTMPSAPVISRVTKRIESPKSQVAAPGVSHGSLPLGRRPRSIRYCLSAILASSAEGNGPSLLPSRVVKYHLPSTTKYRSLRNLLSSFGSEERFMAVPLRGDPSECNSAIDRVSSANHKLMRAITK